MRGEGRRNAKRDSSSLRSLGMTERGEKGARSGDGEAAALRFRAIQVFIRAAQHGLSGIVRSHASTANGNLDGQIGGPAADDRSFHHHHAAMADGLQVFLGGTRQHGKKLVATDTAKAVRFAKRSPESL